MGNRIWVFHSTGVKWSTTILARIVLQLKPVGRRSRKVGRIYGWRWGVSLSPYKVTWSMGDIISWADYSRKQHRAWKTPPSCGYSTFYPRKTLPFSHTSPCIQTLHRLGKSHSSSLCCCFAGRKTTSTVGGYTNAVTPVPPSYSQVQ